MTPITVNRYLLIGLADSAKHITAAACSQAESKDINNATLGKDILGVVERSMLKKAIAYYPHHQDLANILGWELETLQAKLIKHAILSPYKTPASKG